MCVGPAFKAMVSIAVSVARNVREIVLSSADPALPRVMASSIKRHGSN